jgi:hypothetical protein
MAIALRAVTVITLGLLSQGSAQLRAGSTTQPEALQVEVCCLLLSDCPRLGSSQGASPTKQ